MLVTVLAVVHNRIALGLCASFSLVDFPLFFIGMQMFVLGFRLKIRMMQRMRFVLPILILVSYLTGSRDNNLCVHMSFPFPETSKENPAC